MSVLTGALNMGRTHAEARMTETIKAGPLVQSKDPVTRETITTVQADQTGPARVQYPSLTVADRGVPGQVLAVADITVHRPVGSAIVPTSHWFEVTASTADPSLVGRRFRVKAAPQSGQVTAHRYPVSEES